MTPKTFDLSGIFSIAGRAATSVAFVLLFSACMHSQTFGEGYYRLTTKWLGEERSLDAVDERPQLAATANVTGQMWKLTPLGKGFYKLTTKWLGDDRALDVVAGDAAGKVQFSEAEGVTGQSWKITSAGGGFYRITNEWLGDSKSLDVVNDGRATSIRLAATSNATGQLWKISSLQPSKPVEKASFRDYKQFVFSGFKVKIDPAQAETDEGKQALSLLSQRIDEMIELLSSEQVAMLKKIPIWIEVKVRPGEAMWFHANKDWLVSNGYPAELVKSVEISNVRNFLDWQEEQPLMVFHEFAHGFQDMFMPALQTELEAAYENAKSSGKYDKVAYIKGGTQRAYAMNDKTEYFAELTEAYFGKNDYFPFVREELKQFDPVGYKLMQKAWGPR